MYQETTPQDKKLRILIPGKPADVTAYDEMLTRLGAEVTITMKVPAPDEVPGFDGLLIPGGDDIDPARYGQRNTGCRIINPEMDALQFDTLKLFLAEGKPVMGVCNGMQMINICFGGDLIQDIPTKEDHQSHDGVYSVHSVRSEPGTWAAQLFGESFTVNSSHHQAVGRTGTDLEVILRAPDGVAEGIAHKKLPVFGVQFHPERMTDKSGTLACGDVFYLRFLKMCGET